MDCLESSKELGDSPHQPPTMNLRFFHLQVLIYSAHFLADDTEREVFSTPISV